MALFVFDIYLEAEPDSVQIDGVWRLHVTEALSEGIHPDLPPLPERGLHVLLPDALDAEVGELHGHVLAVDVLLAHAHLAAPPSHLSIESYISFKVELLSIY